MTEAVLRAKNKDYLVGFVDGLIHAKNQFGFERLEINKNELIGLKEQNEILGPSYLSLTCVCGNYVAFKSGDELPEKSLKCTLCDEVYLIYYYMDGK